MTPRERFLAAVASRPVDRPPVWMMRQAGRYLPEYRALRAQHAFLDCVHRPELAAELTLQPLRRYAFDAGIVFSDILIVLEAMGLGVSFPAGGPRVEPRLSDGDASSLRPVDAARDFAWLAEALRLVREGAGPERAILGFAGAPFTLACYAVEGSGSRDFARVRALLHGRPAAFQDLLARLADAVADLLLVQVAAGADAVQLFDSWGGLLSEADWRRHVAPHVARIVERVHAAGGTIVLFVKDGGHLLDAALDCGPDVIGLDWRADVAQAARRVAGRAAVQGNLDPAALLAPREEIRRQVRRIHADVAGRTGHVFNLGHGVLPETPVDGVQAFVDAALELAEPAAEAAAGSSP